MVLEFGRPVHFFGGSFTLIGWLLLERAWLLPLLYSCLDSSGRHPKRCRSSLRLRWRPLCCTAVVQHSNTSALTYFRPHRISGTCWSHRVVQGRCMLLLCLNGVGISYWRLIPLTGGGTAIGSWAYLPSSRQQWLIPVLTLS